MNVINSLKNDIKVAMKNGNKDEVTTLRGIYALAQDIALKENRKDVVDIDVVSAAKKSIKEGKEGIDTYSKINNEVGKLNYDRNMRLVNLASKYVPQNITEDQIRDSVNKIIETNGILMSMSSMGTVMKLFKEAYPDGNYDGKTVSIIVREILSNMDKKDK